MGCENLPGSGNDSGLRREHGDKRSPRFGRIAIRVVGTPSTRLADNINDASPSSLSRAGMYPGGNDVRALSSALPLRH
jgi:hypothetical protein